MGGWERKTKKYKHTHTNKKRKKRKRDFIHKQIKENCKFGAAGHIQKAGVNIAQLRSGVSLATYKANHIAVIFLTKSWGKWSTESLKEKMPKSLVNLDRKYLRLPDPSSQALHFLRNQTIRHLWAMSSISNSLQSEALSANGPSCPHYLLMPSKQHKAATVPHASEQRNRSHLVTHIFLRSPTSPTHAVHYYAKQQAKPEGIQQFCALHIEVFFYTHTSSTQVKSNGRATSLDFWCPSFGWVPTPLLPLTIYGMVAIPYRGVPGTRAVNC